MKEIILLVSDKTYTSDEMALALETLASIGLLPKIKLKNESIGDNCLSRSKKRALCYVNGLPFGDVISKRYVMRKWHLKSSDADDVFSSSNVEIICDRPRMYRKLAA